MKKLAIMVLSAPLFLYAPAFASSQAAPISKFDPVEEYCNQSIDSKYPLSLSEVLMGSDIHPDEQRIILLHYLGIDKNELDEMCLEYHFSWKQTNKK